MRRQKALREPIGRNGECVEDVGALGDRLTHDRRQGHSTLAIHVADDAHQGLVSRHFRHARPAVVRRLVDAEIERVVAQLVGIEEAGGVLRRDLVAAVGRQARAIGTILDGLLISRRRQATLLHQLVKGAPVAQLGGHGDAGLWPGQVWHAALDHVGRHAAHLLRAYQLRRQVHVEGAASLGGMLQFRRRIIPEIREERLAPHRLLHHAEDLAADSVRECRVSRQSCLAEIHRRHRVVRLDEDHAVERVKVREARVKRLLADALNIRCAEFCSLPAAEDVSDALALLKAGITHPLRDVGRLQPWEICEARQLGVGG